MVVTKAELGGEIIGKYKQQQIGDIGEEIESVSQQVSARWFKFVQTADGSIPTVLHAQEEFPTVINIKKAITAAFQANFLGTSTKMEADPQSSHTAKYRYSNAIIVQKC